MGTRNSGTRNTGSGGNKPGGGKDAKSGDHAPGKTGGQGGKGGAGDKTSTPPPKTESVIITPPGVTY